MATTTTSYGSITITEVQEGSQIWTTTVAPNSPNYTFAISNLTGDPETSVKAGDIIMHSYYRYTVLSVSADGTTVLAGNRVSIRGETGASAVTYSLIVSNLAVVKDKNGDISPTSITLTAKSQTGSSAMADYAGRFKIETTTDNSTWATQYTSSANESTKTWNVINDIIAIRCSLYLKDGTTTLLDQQTIPVISDGLDGTNGNDAYSIVLTNDNHTFAGNTTSAIASQMECNVIAYKGTTQVAATIGTITGQPTGMTTALLNNGTTNSAFRVSVSGDMTTRNGTLNIPLTIDGKSFTKEFTYSLALNGKPLFKVELDNYYSAIPVDSDGKTISDCSVGIHFVGRKGEDAVATSLVKSSGGGYPKLFGISPQVMNSTISYDSNNATIVATGYILYIIPKDTVITNDKGNINFKFNLDGASHNLEYKYCWSKVTQGKDGTSISITSTSVTYQEGTSGTVQPTGTWETNIPTVAQDNYLWTKTVVNYSDNSSTESYSVSRNAVNGTNGTSPTVSSTVTEYTQTTSGTTTPTSGWDTTPPSAIAGRYMWTKVTVTYSDGATAVSYTVSKNGTNGNNGINTATVYLYKRGTTAPSVPSGNTTYTFSTKNLTGTLDDWSQTIPTSGDGQCYVIAAVASSNGTTDTIGTGEWSTPIQFNGTNGTNGTDGTNGLNQATIFLYKRGTSVTKPTTSVTYTFSTGALSAEPNSWKRNIPTIDGNPCWVVSATAISNDTSVTITGNNWSDPVKLVEDGKDGGRWYSGTSITGTSTTATVFSGSGISSAVIGDMYLNTSTYNTYRCTLGGDASTAKWVYVNNIKGVHGDTGKGVSSIVNQYYLSTSNTTQTGGSWSSTVPPYVEDCYYWTKSHIVWTDNTETDTTAVLDNGLTDANTNAIDARKVATNYLAVDNTGIMIADMEDGEQTPSGILTGKNVFIDSDSVDVRNGQTVLSSFGDNAIIIGQYGKSRLMLSPTMISGISDVGYKNFNIISGDSSEEETTITKSGNFENESSETGVFHGSINFSEKFYYFHKVTATVVFNYIWDGEQQTTDPLTLDIDDPVEDETGNVWLINGSVVNSSYVIEYGISCSIQHNGEITFLYFDTNAKLTPKNTSISASYEIESTAPYSIVIETKVYKNTSYTFGSRKRNSEQGNYSFTIGEQLIASSDNQVAIGVFNNDDPNKNYAFMIGNGIYDENHKEHRSNAFTVDCDGNTEVMGNLEVNNNQIVTNNSTVGGNETVTGDLTVSGTITDTSNSYSLIKNLNVGTFKLSTRTPVYRKRFYWTAEIGANSNWSRIGTNASLDGYTPVGVVSFGCFNASSGASSNVDWCVITKCYVWATTLDVYVWNQNTGASARCGVYVDVLYFAIGMI